MPEFNNFLTGYGPSVLALTFVLAYFAAAALLVRLPGPAGVLVPRYEPPPNASPAVAAWLFERGKLPRAMAAAIVNMAAKRFLEIKQSGDFYSLAKLESKPSTALEPEEDALDRVLFSGYDIFDFDEATPQLTKAIRAFRWALNDTTYFSEHIALSIPGWVGSGFGVLVALFQGLPFAYSNGNGRLLGADIVWTLGFFVVAVRTLPGPSRKLRAIFPAALHHDDHGRARTPGR
jgi:hypothetical protein